MGGIIMKKVLIVDDEMDCHLVLIDQLENRGVSVIEAFDGMAGVQFFHKHQPDVTICDTNMPKLNGPGVVDEILKISPKAKIIGCSNNQKPNLSFPASIPFFQKPVPLEAVLKLLW